MWPFRTSKSGYSSIDNGLDRQSFCKGCKVVEVVLEEYQAQLQSQNTFPILKPLRMHEGFEELQECAKVCLLCRIFRRALLLQCATTESAGQLATETLGYPVYARFEETRSHAMKPRPRDLVGFKIEISNPPRRSAEISCASTITKTLNLCANPHADLVAQQVKG